MAAEMRAGVAEQVQNGDAADWTEAGQQQGLQHRYQLSPAATPDRSTVAGCATRSMKHSRCWHAGSSAIRPLLEQDPTGEMQRIAEG